VLAALAAELVELQPLGGRLAVLGGRIIFIFARSALQLANFAGHCLQLLYGSLDDSGRRALSESKLGNQRDVAHPAENDLQDGRVPDPQTT
jgi:hypothetical protein